MNVLLNKDGCDVKEFDKRMRGSEVLSAGHIEEGAYGMRRTLGKLVYFR